MFNLISKIKYFRTYLIGRCFRRWHKVCLACPALASTCEVDKSSCHCTCWDAGMPLGPCNGPQRVLSGPQQGPTVEHASKALCICCLVMLHHQKPNVQASDHATVDLQEVRRKLFARVRHSVCSKLFLAKPTFCQHLVEINQFVSDISQVKMSYCNSNHLYQLEEYSDLQVVTREQKAKPALESTSEKVQQVSHTLQLSCCTGTGNSKSVTTLLSIHVLCLRQSVLLASGNRQGHAYGYHHPADELSNLHQMSLRLFVFHICHFCCLRDHMAADCGACLQGGSEAGSHIPGEHQRHG